MHEAPRMPSVGQRFHALELRLFTRLVRDGPAAEIHADADARAIENRRRPRHSTRRAVEVDVHIDDALLRAPRIGRPGSNGGERQEQKQERFHDALYRAGDGTWKAP